MHVVMPVVGSGILVRRLCWQGTTGCVPVSARSPCLSHLPSPVVPPHGQVESLAIDIAKKEAEIDKQDGVIANLEAKMAPHEEAAADCEARLAELNEEKGGHAAKQNKRVNHLAEIETSIKRRTKHLREQQAVGGAKKGQNGGCEGNAEKR